MLKVLAGLAGALLVVLGAQAYNEQRYELRQVRSQLESARKAQASAPPSVVPFEVETLAASDLVGKEVVLLYLYKASERSAKLEEQLRTARKEYPNRVTVVPVRAEAAEGASPEGIEELGTPITDAEGKLAASYGVSQLPAVVALKGRPVYHASFAEASTDGGVEQCVDSLVARDDLVPVAGGCGGDCGMGGCGAEMMMGGGGCAAP